MKVSARLTAVLFVCFTFSNAFALDAIVKRNATVRGDPSTHHAPTARLSPQDEVELLEPSPTSGYYHVRTENGEEGWVYSRNLEPISAAPPEPSGTNPGAAPPPDSTSPNMGVATVIPPDWERPEPNKTTFHGEDGDCGPTGDSGDKITNARKNRTDVPAKYHPATWRALQALPYPKAGKSLDDWTPQQLAQIEPYQGVAISIVGYLVAVKPQKGGKGESTNCHFTGADEVDWHMALTERANEPEAKAVVVETTPRVRQTHPNWTVKSLAPWIKSTAPVRISGWTMLDPEHRNHLGRYRSTLWEIHPITKIEVFEDGQWINSDNLPQ